MADFNEQKHLLIKYASNLSALCKKAEATDLRRKTDSLLSQMKDNRFYITIVGEFNRGKSTLINAFLRDKILPSAIRETTATINKMVFSNEPAIKVIDNEGAAQSIPFSKGVLREYTALNEFDSSTIDHIEIQYPAEILKKDVVIVDTPGVNDINQQRADVTYRFMPKSDATLFLLDSQKPFTASEERFLKEQVLKNNISTIYFLINKVDHLAPSKLSSIIDNVKGKLATITEHNNSKIYAISSLNALNGYINKNDEAVKNSGVITLENDLNKFIKSSDRSKAFIKKNKQNLLNIIDALQDELDIKISHNNATIDQLKEEKNNLNTKESSIREDFNHITRYLKTDEDALLTKVETALNTHYEELNESLTADINAREENIEAYAKYELPSKIKQATKEWFEKNEDSVELYQHFSMNNALITFNKHFSKKAIIEQITSTKNRVEINPSFSVSRDKLEDTEILSGGTGVVLAGSLALLTGGLSLIALLPAMGGWFIGTKFMAPLFSDKILKEQKAALITSTNESLTQTREQVILELKNHVSNYYELLRSRLEEELETTISEINSELAELIEEMAKDRKRVEITLNHYSTLIDDATQIREQLSNLN